MAEFIVNKGVVDQKMVSVYCTAELLKGRVVALDAAGTAVPTGATGVGLGGTVGYPITTESVCVGILHGGNSAYTTFGTGWAPCICRGYAPEIGAYGTLTDTFDLMMIDESRLKGIMQGEGLTEVIPAAFTGGPFFYAIALGVDGTAQATHTVKGWVKGGLF